jgi:peptidoglycan/LPS O-acetylase OafA/YrhL
MSVFDRRDSSISLPTSDRPKIRLVYLDGVRGLAAFYVVLFHIYQECTAKREMPAIVLSAGKFLAYAEIAVAIFIVLSGYCLMLPVVRSGKDQIPGGVLNYLKRRAKRILPTYYAALFLSLLLLALTIGFQSFTGFHWDALSLGFQPGVAPSLGAIASHLLLVHNWDLDWAYAIDGSMWSMATEWQIYFLFAMLLVPIYRRFGIIAAVVIAFVLGLAPHYLWSEWTDYTVSPWFAGLFALGMAGAFINFSDKPLALCLKRYIPWGVIAIALWIVIVAIVVPEPAPLGVSRELSCLGGLAAVCSLVYLTNASDCEIKCRPLLLQLFENPYLVKLGTFSYSLYLTHIVVVVLVHQFLLSQHVPPTLTFLSLLIVAVPLSLLVAHTFYLLVEQRSLSSRAIPVSELK